MKAFGASAFVLLIVVSFLLLCVVAFAGDEFRTRSNWQLQATGNWKVRTDLGRLFCLVLFRAWLALCGLNILFFAAVRYVA